MQQQVAANSSIHELTSSTACSWRYARAQLHKTLLHSVFMLLIALRLRHTVLALRAQHVLSAAAQPSKLTIGAVATPKSPRTHLQHIEIFKAIHTVAAKRAMKASLLEEREEDFSENRAAEEDVVAVY